MLSPIWYNKSEFNLIIESNKIKHRYLHITVNSYEKIGETFENLLSLGFG